jgi:hypothetical protein
VAAGAMRWVGLGLGRQQMLGVGMLWRGEHRARSDPCSTIFAVPFMTQTRSAILRTIVESCVMNNNAMPSLQGFQQRQDLRLHGHVERGGRLVGDQQAGSLASAMAIMTRWRWPPENWCG